MAHVDSPPKTHVEEDRGMHQDKSATSKNELSQEVPKIQADSRKSLRDRKPTSKMADLQDEEVIKKERKFFKCYGVLKTNVKGAREAVKTETDEESINSFIESLEAEEHEMVKLYNDLRGLRIPLREVREKMDRASSMVRNTINALEEVLGSLGGPFDADDRNEIAQQLLRHDYAISVYSTHISKATKSKDSDRSTSSEKLRLEAELAAKEVEAKQNAAIEAQRAKVRQMEQDRDVEAIRAKLNVYQKADSNDNKSQTLTDESDGEGAANTIDEDVIVVDSSSMGHERFQRDTPADTTTGQRPFASKNASTFKQTVAPPHNKDCQASQPPHSVPPLRPQVFDTNSFAQALADGLQKSRLPVPVPQTFSGNPLEFPDFERSFKTLIENRGIPPEEKLYYLKQYVTGPAKEAVSGFFFGATEEAYNGAWKTLRERYGHPFKIQQAFRDRLNKWPRIGPKDAPALQKFADFLKNCHDAMPYVKGLQVLNDCLENQKLLHKLPEWIASRWNRVVTDSLEGCGRYPTFPEFVAFVAKEARIANNPISSLVALKGQEVSSKGESRVKDRREVPRDKGSAFVTKGEEQGDSRASVESEENGTGGGDGSATQMQTARKHQDKKKVPKPCILCSATDHQLGKCTEFMGKSLPERKVYIQQNQICFGCLRKGHFSKDCVRRHRCDVCSKRHPTSIHEHRQEADSEGAQNQTQAKATSCQARFGTQASTSMIVPVWIATEQAPSTEILTYALLDTQSDSSFILDEVAQALNVGHQPVRLKLSTMSSSSTVDSNVVPDLLVRGMTLPTQIKMGRCYTRDFIPVDRHHIPTRTTAEKWSHLQDVAREMPALQGCEVGLLIGYNCPRALAPRQVVTGTGTEPYAVQTELGWSIVGSSESKTDKDWTSQCCRVVTTEMPSPTPQDVLRTVDVDFAEKHHGDVSSQNDIPCDEHLEANSSQCADSHLQMPHPFQNQPELSNNRGLATTRPQIERKMERHEIIETDMPVDQGR